MNEVKKTLPRCRIFLLDGKKFCTNLLVLFFEIPLKRETATKTALLAEILKREQWQDAVKQAEEYYGALWDVSVVKKGDRQLLLFSLETLKAVEMEEAVSFLRERVFALLKKDGISEKSLKRQKEILRRKLESIQDDKKAYARKRSLEETAEGTDYAVSGEGYLEDLEEINGKELFRWYRNLTETAAVKVFFCGDKGERKKVLSLRKEFPGNITDSLPRESEQAKKGPRFLQEQAEVVQARLIMGFSAAVENGHRQAALLLLNHLLGGSPDSLLFQDVREEQGLCYDVKSYLEPLSPFLFIEAGIRQEDARKVGKQVLHCIEQMKKEGVSEKKLQQAKKNILRNYHTLSDSSWGMVDFFAEQALQGRELTTEKMLRQIERIEAEDIMGAARHLELKTIYLLSGKEGQYAAE